MNKKNIIYRGLRKVFHVFFPVPTKEELKRRKQLEDYEFLKSRGVDTQLGYVELFGKPIINIASGAHVVMKKGVLLISETKGNYAGINHPVTISAECSGAEIILNEKSGMSGGSLVAVEGIEIGEGTMLGANTNVYDTDFHLIDAEERKNQKGIIDALHAKVVIGKQCWIGANSTILKGVTIGDKTVVGTMSLVNHSLPASVLAAGVPAKVIRNI